MRVSTKGRYALRMLIDLAVNQNDKYVALKDISERQNISKKYLEQIIPYLHEANLLDSMRGNQGGYRLKKAPEDIFLYDILSHTENELLIVPCLDMEDCDYFDKCMAKEIWAELNEIIIDYLKKVSLASIIKRGEDKLY